MNARYTTVPVRCAACGQQTHTTLQSAVQKGGLMCECGTFTVLDVEAFAEEIRKAEARIEDFGRKALKR